MCTPHWGRGWVVWLPPAGELVSGLQGYSPLGRGWVACALPAQAEGGLPVHSPLRRRVGCMVTSFWGSWFLVTSYWGI